MGEGLPLKIYIGSADLMGRNLDRRVEVLVPIHHPELPARFFEVLDLVFADETNAWSSARTAVGAGSRTCTGSVGRGV